MTTTQERAYLALMCRGCPSPTSSQLGQTVALLELLDAFAEAMADKLIGYAGWSDESFGKPGNVAMFLWNLEGRPRVRE